MKEEKIEKKFQTNITTLYQSESRLIAKNRAKNSPTDQNLKKKVVVNLQKKSARNATMLPKLSLLVLTMSSLLSQTVQKQAKRSKWGQTLWPEFRLLTTKEPATKVINSTKVIKTIRNISKTTQTELLSLTQKLNFYKDEVIGLIGNASSSRPSLKGTKFYTYAYVYLKQNSTKVKNEKIEKKGKKTKRKHKKMNDSAFYRIDFNILHEKVLMSTRISGEVDIPLSTLRRYQRARKHGRDYTERHAIKITRFEELVTQESDFKDLKGYLKIHRISTRKDKFMLDCTITVHYDPKIDSEDPESPDPNQKKNSKNSPKNSKNDNFSDSEHFQWRLVLKDADYEKRLRDFRSFLIGCSIMMIFGVLGMMENTSTNQNEYLERISFITLFLEMMIITSLLYHFGVLIPVDIKCLFPFMVLVFNFFTVWLAKLNHIISNSSFQNQRRSLILVLSFVTLVGGLFLPSLDKNGIIFLIVAILPLIVQVIHGFKTTNVTMTKEYNGYFKAFQVLLIREIYGSKTPVHLLPTDEATAHNFTMSFLFLVMVLMVQKYYHPRFFFKGWIDRRAARHRPKLLRPEELLERRRKALKLSLEDLSSASDDELKSINSDGVRNVADGKGGCSHQSGGRVREDDFKCSICYMPLEVTEGSAACLETPCGHIFHYDCLVKWIEKKKSCPLCRRKCTHPDPYYYD